MKSPDLFPLLWPHTPLQWVEAGLDWLIVSFLIYKTLIWIKNTRSGPLVRGLFAFFIIFLASRFLGLLTLNWLLEKLSVAFILVAIIVFQGDIRRALEKIGTGSLFTPLLAPPENQNTAIIKHILKAVSILAKEKIGALIVIEVGSNLAPYAQSGIPVQAPISSDLLASLFWPKSPTHDGAVILRENRIEAAGCLLPLTDTLLSDRRLGTRHRAAIGLSQLTDAVIVVISEESGVISLAETGNLTRYLTREALESRLFNLYREIPTTKSS